MSTAAQSPIASPTSSPTSSGYSFARARGKCSICGRDIAPGEKFTAAVRETDAGLERLDLAGECWESFDRAPLLAFWHATMPTGPVAKPKVFVDDSVLCDLFQRLSEAGDEPAKANFRFVLGLILMRKRLIAYESTHFDEDREYWTVRMKGSDQIIDLLNPRLDEQQIADVSAQLSQVLSGEAA
ncbi:MAG: hypothetical protein ABSH22_17435 [Tepidisphaeraceae bacterium]|jgi:hypothetical protein